MIAQKNKNTLLYTIYWFLLFYTIAALCWWFFELYHHNISMAGFRLKELNIKSETYNQDYNQIIKNRNSNTFQFIGEGLAFLIVIITGALFLFKILVKELKRNAEQRNFVMAITHELKTPIAVSKLNLETIQKHNLSKEQQNKLIINTLSETIRLDALCNNLLVSYQLDENAFKVTNTEINLSEHLGNIIKSFQTHFPKREIITNLQEQVFIKGDFFLLEIAINNLLENAAKYSPKEKPITIILTSENNLALLFIEDQGEGISDDDKKLVFKKFYRIGNEATRNAKGTGLGLYLVFKICILHDGKITIQNNPKGGSVFTFVLNTIG
jgi:two-component system, OmpR family, sensor histidine kinase CiaH